MNVRGLTFSPLYLLGIGVALSLGIYLRSVDYLDRNFTIDEAWRARSIVEADSFSDLDRAVQPNEYLFGKVGLSLFGTRELAFRIWPWLFSCLSLVVFAAITVAYFSPPVAILGTSLLALSKQLVVHAHEFKPYSFEAFLTLSLIYVFTLAQRDAKHRISGTALLLITAVLSPNLYPFFLPIVLILLRSGEGLQRFQRRLEYGLVLASLTTFISYWFTFYPTYFEHMHRWGFYEYWFPCFLSSPDGIARAVLYEAPRRLEEYLFTGIRFVDNHAVFTLATLVVLAILGPWRMWARRSRLYLWVVIPFSLQLGFSYFAQYPIFTRVNTFIYPILLLSGLYVIDDLFDLSGRFNRGRQQTIAIAVTVGVMMIWSVPRISEIRQTLDQQAWRFAKIFPVLDAAAKKAELAPYVNFMAEDLWRFHVHSRKLNSGYRQLPIHFERDAVEEFFDNLAAVPHARGQTIWLLGAHEEGQYWQQFYWYQDAARERGWSIVEAIKGPFSYLVGIQVPS